MTNFNATETADSHAGMHGDFTVYWDETEPGWFTIGQDSPVSGPFETSQAAFLAYVAAFDAEVRAGLAQG